VLRGICPRSGALLWERRDEEGVSQKDGMEQQLCFGMAQRIIIIIIVVVKSAWRMLWRNRRLRLPEEGLGERRSA
jgi:hypothetical protein